MAASSGFFPGTPQETPGASANEDENEEKLLREQLKILTEELRLLTETVRSQLPQAPHPNEKAPDQRIGIEDTEDATDRVNEEEELEEAEMEVTGEDHSEEGMLQAVRPEPRVSAKPTQDKAASETSVVKVVSAGHESGNVADFFVDDVQIPVALGPAGRRGLNLVIINPERGQVVSARSYDIWGDPLEEQRRLREDLRGLPSDTVVLAALKDSGMENLVGDTLSALRRCGAEIEGRLGERESYALIGAKDGESLAERYSDRMVLIEARLPFKVTPLGSAASGAARTAPPSQASRPAAAAAAQSTARASSATASPPKAAPGAGGPSPAALPQRAPASAPSTAPAPSAPRPSPTAAAAAPAAAGAASAAAAASAEGRDKTWREVVDVLEKLKKKIQERRMAEKA